MSFKLQAFPVLLSALCLTASQAFAERFDFGSLVVETKDAGGFSVFQGETELFSASLFMRLEAPSGTKEPRVFQNGGCLEPDSFKREAFIKNGAATLACAGTLENKELKKLFPFKQALAIAKDGSISVSCEIDAGAAEFQETPRLLACMPLKTVAGKGVEAKKDGLSSWQVVLKNVDGDSFFAGAAKLDLLRVATACGPLEFVCDGEGVSFHDTRRYSKDGSALRVDLPAVRGGDGVWRVSARIKTPAENIEAPVKILESMRRGFVPNFSTWDIYSPYLKRTELSGWWRLKLRDDSKSSEAGSAGDDAFLSAGFDDSGWDQVMVPQNWSISGSRAFIRPGAEGASDSLRSRLFNGTGWYRRSFEAPALAKGERAILHFEETALTAEVRLNGVPLGRIPSIQEFALCRMLCDSFEIDATSLLKPGVRNEIAVKVSTRISPSVPSWSLYGGLTGRVWLDVRPECWCAETLVTPRKNLKSVSARCLIGSAVPLSEAPSWKYEVFEWASGKVVASGSVSGALEKDAAGRQFVETEIAMDNPTPWSCENPFLYGVRIKTRNGDVAGIKRFGLRTFVAEGGFFLLNGKPTALRGVVADYSDVFLAMPLGQNEGDVLRRFWKRYRDANINHLRLHSCRVADINYDIFDELGILVCDELAYPSTPIAHPEKADEIAAASFASACEPDGALKPLFRDYAVRRLEALYSHPSVAMFSYGNEIRDEGVFRRMTNNLYSLYKSVDRQNRPITTSSGRFWKETTNMNSALAGDKLDYIDTHDYTGSINSKPISFCQPVAEHFIVEERKAFKGRTVPPTINGETVYFDTRFYEEFYGRIWPSADSEEPDWKQYLWALVKMDEKYPDHRRMSYYWVRNWGVYNYKYHREEGLAYYIERILEVNRKLWPQLSGYEALSGRTFFPKGAPPFSESSFEPNKAYEALKQVSAPAVVVLDHVSPNVFSGETLELRATVVNNTEREIAALSFDVSLSKDGAPLLVAAPVELKSIPVGGKRATEAKIQIPAGMDRVELSLNYSISERGKTLCARSLWLDVRDRKTLFAPLPAGRKVQLYDGVENVFTGMGRPSASSLFKAFGVKFEALESFSALDPEALLAIGADSIDSNVIANASALRAFLEKGGRILVFEQHFVGRLPFAPELEYMNAGYGQFAEIMRRDSPLAAGLRQKELLCWNQADWSVYHSFVRPLSEAATLVGGDSTEWGADNFGMVVSFGKLGQGELLLCQAETTKLFATDSGAAALARNILATATSRQAFDGLPAYRGGRSKLASFASAKPFFVSLEKAANRGFADEKAGDGEGGWTDQGPTNDLRSLEPGMRCLGGVPFKIINPTANGGKACVMVSANDAARLPAVSAPIEIGAKLKTLYFLNASAWTPTKGIVGKYLISYADGSVVELPLEAGVNIGDWWKASAELAGAECVWSAPNGLSVVGLFAFSWINPKPDVEIVNARLECVDPTARIGLAAMTGAQ